MPVRINSLGSQDPASFAITQDEYNQGRIHFETHYHLASGQPYTGQDFKLRWDELANAVETYKGTYNVPDENIAMRFTHCFDEVNSVLYLRLSICEMELTSTLVDGCQVWQLLDNDHQLLYDLNEESLTVANPGSAGTDQYLTSFVYTPVPAGEVSELLVDDGGHKFARTITFPWQNEILQMYSDNDSPADAFIHFASCSYTEDYTGQYAVKWPHGLVMYLEANGITYLDNNSSLTIFSYKGADLGTVCPPRCDVYIAPSQSSARTSQQQTGDTKLS